jgi:geranylgeranyl diphosphate synthase type II
MAGADIKELMQQTEAWITPELESVFAEDVREDITVKAASYSLFAGGKRLRPMMMHLTSEMLGLDPETDSDVKYFAATLEMIHTYSLIHDDLPAMDNDDLRRGKPTCHVVYGEGIATLAGDLLLNTAMERLFAISEKKPGYIYAASAMAKNAGLYGMIGGQSIDIDSTEKKISIDLLIELQEKKTGALIEASIVTPYYVAKQMSRAQSATDEIAVDLRKLASHIGLAFQIRDDILDVISDSSVLGKSTGKDERDSKATFVTLLGLDGAEKRLSEEISSIKSILAKFADKGFDTGNYETLTDYLENRNK